MKCAARPPAYRSFAAHQARGVGSFSHQHGRNELRPLRHREWEKSGAWAAAQKMTTRCSPPKHHRRGAIHRAQSPTCRPKSPYRPRPHRIPLWPEWRALCGGDRGGDIDGLSAGRGDRDVQCGAESRHRRHHRGHQHCTRCDSGTNCQHRLATGSRVVSLPSCRAGSLVAGLCRRD